MAKQTASGGWGKRWRQSLEGIGLGDLLQKGSGLVKRGLVSEPTLEEGSLVVRVQGSGKGNQSVSLHLHPFTEGEWQRVAHLAAGHPLADRLRQGETPPEVEEVFAAAGLALVPASARDLTVRCACPDGAAICKHAAAMLASLAEPLDRDPFLLWELRGMLRTQWQALLSDPAPHAGVTALLHLASDPECFWDFPQPLPEIPPPEPDTSHPPRLLTALGQAPVPHSPPLTEWLEHLYAAVSREARSRRIPEPPRQEEKPSSKARPLF